MRRATLALTCLLFFGSGLAADRPFLVQPTWRKYHVWETTLHVTVPRAKAAPKIDGTLDDACWKDALRLSDFAGHKAQRYASMPSELLLTYDDTNLYVAFRCREEQIEKLRLARAREMGEGHVWKDDCVEIFIAPQMPGPKPGDTADVFHFIGTPRGAREDWRYLFGRTPAGAIAQLSRHSTRSDYGVLYNPAWQNAGSVDRAKGLFCVEFAIPPAALKLKRLREGARLFLNAARERKPGNEELTCITAAAFADMRYFATAALGAKADVQVKLRPEVELDGSMALRWGDEHLYYPRDVRPETFVDIKHRLEDIQGGTLACALMSATTGKPIRASRLPVEGTKLLAMADTADLPTGHYEVRASLISPKGKVLAEDRKRFERVATWAERVKSGQARPIALDVPDPPKGEFVRDFKVTVANPVRCDVRAWPMRTGVPFPRDHLRDARHVILTRPDGSRVACQKQVLATWDKSGKRGIKWLLLDFQDGLEAGEAKAYRVIYGERVRPDELVTKLRALDADTAIRVDTGALRFAVRKKGFAFMQDVHCGDRQIADSGPQALWARDATGALLSSAWDQEGRVEIETAGPLRVTLRAEGSLCRKGAKPLGRDSIGRAVYSEDDSPLRYVVRIHAYAGKPYVQVEHTFVIDYDTMKGPRVSDIVLSIPAKAGRAAFGVVDGESITRPVGAKGAYLLQHFLDRFEVVAADGVMRGKRSAGWTSGGGVRVAVQELWQNYPKEFEWTPTGLNVHFWPAHNKDRATPTKATYPSREEWCRLSYAHEGKLLDLGLPASFGSEQAVKRLRIQGLMHVDRGRLAHNAQGVAKTHRLWIDFSSETANADACAAFEVEPHPMPDVQRIYACDASGFRLQPEAPAFLPDFERISRLGYDEIQDMEQSPDSNSYHGMFLWGNRHNYPGQQRKAHISPSVVYGYRFWNMWHHNKTLYPWFMYLRTGEGKYLPRARATSRYLADVGVVHAERPQTMGLRKGIAHTYKRIGYTPIYYGYVPWYGGDAATKDASFEVLLWPYYLFGDARMREVVESMGHACDTSLDKTCEWQRSRAGHGLFRAMVRMYQATWDERWRRRVQEGRDFLMQRPAATQGWMCYTPWLSTYAREFRDEDPEAVTLLLEFAEDLMRRRGAKTAAPVQFYNAGYGDVFTECYFATGDVKYLLPLFQSFKQQLVQREVNRPELYARKGLMWYWYWYHSVFALPALKHYGIHNIPLGGGQEPGLYTLFMRGPKTTVHVLEEQDGEIRVEAMMWQGDPRRNRIELFDPFGRGLGTFSSKSNVLRVAKTLPTDGVTGVYRLVFTGSGKLNAHPQRGDGELPSVIEFQKPQQIMIYSGELYAKPTHREPVEVKVLGYLTIVTPDWHVAAMGGEYRQVPTVTLKFRPDPIYRFYHFLTYKDYGFIDSKGLEPFFTLHPSTYFDPRTVKTQRAAAAKGRPSAPAK